MGIVRRSRQELPGFGSTSERKSAGVSGSSLRFWLEQVYGFRRLQPLHRNLRRLGASQAIVEKIRLQCRKDSSCGQRPDRATREQEMKVGLGADHGGFEMK